MSIMKRAMDFLGLGPDDAYDDYDMPVEHERPSRSRAPRDPEPMQRSSRNAYEPEEELVTAEVSTDEPTENVAVEAESSGPPPPVVPAVPKGARAQVRRKGAGAK